MPRRPHRRRYLIAASITAVLIAGMWWVTRPDTGTDRPPSRAGSAATAEGKVAKQDKKRVPKRTFTKREHRDLDRSEVGAFPESDLPGLPGGSVSGDVPPLDLRITVTSSSPIGIVGWTIPTSPDNSSGQATVSGGSWSLSTVVYGRPDYARVFLQAGATGAPITCTISVEGRVTERRATVGPYGQLMCQG